VLIWTVLPHALRRATRTASAVDYWGGGLRGFIGREVFNAVLVDRSGATREPISVIMEAMEQGTPPLISPEAPRNPGDQPLLPFKSGLYRMATARPDVEFVPVW